MKTYFNQILQHPLVSGAAVIFVGSLAGNVFNFLFNFFVIRSISVVDYGIIASLASLILLFALIADSFVPTVVQFAGAFFAKKELGNVRDLYWKLSLPLFSVAFIILGGFVYWSGDIGKFLQIPQPFFVALTGVSIFFGFILMLNRSVLLANLSFGYVAIVNLSSSVVKFLAGVLLIYLGYSVAGALWAFAIFALVAYVLCFGKLGFLFKGGRGNTQVTFSEILRYGSPAAVALLSLTLFITSDVLLVKHFFSPQQAGVYAGMSLLGKIIYFFSAPLTQVMFPLIVQKRAKMEKYAHLFNAALLIVSVACIGITTFYFLFPDFSILLLLKNKSYLVISPILGLFAIFMSVFCLLSVTVNFYLSTKRTKVAIPVFIAASLQIVLIWFFHQSFLQVIIISISIISLLLACLLLYYWKLYGGATLGKAQTSPVRHHPRV